MPKNTPNTHGGHHHHEPGAAAAADPHALRRLWTVLAVTGTVFIAEVVGSYLASSLALFADAAHMFVDSAGLLIALSATYLARRPATNTYTWGLARVEVVSAAFQAGILLTMCASIVYQAFERLSDPQPIETGIMMIFGIIGLAGNLISVGVLAASRDHNLNFRAAFLEVLTDSLGSVAVIVAALVVQFTGQIWVDVALSLLIGAMMGPRAWVLLRSAVAILLERTPEGLDLEQVRSHMVNNPGVLDVHDLHVSTIASGTFALSAHVTLSDQALAEGKAVQTLHDLQDCLAEHFPVSIRHCTIQIDSAAHRDHEHLEHARASAPEAHGHHHGHHHEH